MANERNDFQQQQPEPGNTDNENREQKEQFNELSELSLEERMNVADQMGIPVGTLGEAVATGAVRGPDNAAEESDRFEEESGGESDR